MPTSSTSPPIYPAFCFNHSPTFAKWTKLTVCGIHTLHQPVQFRGQDVFFYGNHPIQYVRVVGMITQLELFSSGYYGLIIDDGSGYSVEASCRKTEGRIQLGKNEHQEGLLSKQARVDLKEDPKEESLCRTQKGNIIDLTGLEMGMVIKIKGGIRRWWDENRISLERFEIVHSTSEEIRLWQETADHHSQVLSIPWTLSREQIQEMREEELRTQARKSREGQRADRRRQKEDKPGRKANSGAVERHGNMVTRREIQKDHPDRKRLPLEGLDPSPVRAHGEAEHQDCVPSGPDPNDKFDVNARNIFLSFAAAAESALLGVVSVGNLMAELSRDTDTRPSNTAMADLPNRLRTDVAVVAETGDDGKKEPPDHGSVTTGVRTTMKPEHKKKRKRKPRSERKTAQRPLSGKI